MLFFSTWNVYEFDYIAISFMIELQNVHESAKSKIFLDRYKWNGGKVFGEKGSHKIILNHIWKIIFLLFGCWWCSPIYSFSMKRNECDAKPHDFLRILSLEVVSMPKNQAGLSVYSNSYKLTKISCSIAETNDRTKHYKMVISKKKN